MKQKPTTESPIEEIHRVRREISDRFEGNISAIAEDAARRQAIEGRPVWQPKTKNKTEQGENENETREQLEVLKVKLMDEADTGLNVNAAESISL
jgi:hypothetical protein